MENCPIVSKYYGNLSIFRFVWLISGRKKPLVFLKIRSCSTLGGVDSLFLKV